MDNQIFIKEEPVLDDYLEENNSVEDDEEYNNTLHEHGSDKEKVLEEHSNILSGHEDMTIELDPSTFSGIQNMEIDAEKLVLLIKKRPPIYNFKLKEHSNRGIVEKLWVEVAKEMSLTVRDCKNKWICLRNSYNRAVRDGQENSASGSKDLKRKKWYLMDAMEFLNAYIGVHRKLGSNSEETTNESLSETQSIMDIPLTHEESLDLSEEVPCRPKRKYVGPDEKVVDPTIDFLKSRTKTTSEEENPTLVFFKSLVPDIDKLTESRKRKFKQSVLNMLYQNLEDQENVTINNTSTSSKSSNARHPSSADRSSFQNNYTLP